MSIGLITTKERTGPFEAILPRGSIVENSGARRPAEVLREFARKAVDEAVVDDAALPEIEASELELLDWAALPQTHPVRIVFAASPSRGEKDRFLQELAPTAVDVVRAQDGAIPLSEIKDRIAHPGKQAEPALSASAPKKRDAKAAAHPLPKGEARIELSDEEDEEMQTMPSWDEGIPDGITHPEAKVRKRKTLSCASLAGHPGVTTLSMSIAMWLATNTRKKVVCALSDTSLFNLLKTGFGSDPGEGSFIYKGVTFTAFAGAEAAAEDAGWAIYDCGHLFTTHADTPASAAHRRFYTSDLKLMCLEGQPWDLPHLKECLHDMSPGEVASWTWCCRGASDDLITQLRVHLGSLGADTARWYKTPEVPDFFGRRHHDGLDKVSFEGILGLKIGSSEDEEGGCL